MVEALSRPVVGRLQTEPAPPARPATEGREVGAGPSCPQCGNGYIWSNWVTTVERCPCCSLNLSRHGWLAAVWINMWATMGLTMAWIVGGLVVTGGDGWVAGGGIAIAVGAPPLLHRYAKGAMLRLLFRFDPPPTHESSSDDVLL